MQKKVLLNANQIDIIINRLVCQLIENHHDFSNTVLIGLQPRGIYLLKKLLNIRSMSSLFKYFIPNRLSTLNCSIIYFSIYTTLSTFLFPQTTLTLSPSIVSIFAPK